MLPHIIYPFTTRLLHDFYFHVYDYNFVRLRSVKQLSSITFIQQNLDSNEKQKNHFSPCSVPEVSYIELEGKHFMQQLIYCLCDKHVHDIKGSVPSVS